MTLPALPPEQGWIRRWGSRCQHEDGSSPVTATFAVAMFLVFLFITVQTTVHLAATAQATAIAQEAAGRAARGELTLAGAQAWAEDRTDGWPGVSAECAADATHITCRVYGGSPAGALKMFGIVSNRATLDRTARARTEAPQ